MMLLSPSWEITLEVLMQRITPISSVTRVRSFTAFLLYNADQFPVKSSPQTIPTDSNQLNTIPDTMKPVGNTFSVFYDGGNPDISTINFCMNTKLSAGALGPGTHSTPGIFDSNWMSPSDQADGKMIYSSFCFLESTILKPFYNQYSRNTQDEVRKNLSIAQDPNSYESAKAITSTGFTFTTFNQTGTDDDYTNTFDVQWVSKPTGASIYLSGKIYIKKTMSKNMGFSTAVAWKDFTTTWSSSIDLNYGYDKITDKANITTSGPQIITNGTTSNEWQNDTAKFWGTLGEIFGTFLDLFTAFQDGNFLANLFSDTTGIDHFSLPDVNVALSSLPEGAKNAFMLPGGDVFFFKNVSILPDGITQMAITYKTATDGPVTTNAVNGDTKALLSAPNTSKKVLHEIRTPWSKKLALLDPKDHLPKQSKQSSFIVSRGSGSGNPVKVPNPKATPKVNGHTQQPKSQINGTTPVSKVNGVPKPNLKSVEASEEKTPLEDCAPRKDQFSLSPLPSSSLKDPLDVTVSSELLHNSLAGMPLAPNEDMVVVQSSDGEALLFSIGSDAKLNLLKSVSATTEAGWETTNLLDSFVEYSSAVCFDVVQAVNGLISLAFALQTPDKKRIDLFYAPLMSHDLSETDFGKLYDISSKVQGIDPAFVSETIRLGTSDDGKRPVLTVEGSLNGKHLLYELNHDDSKASLVELPEDITPGKENLISHCTGFNFGQRGNYFLYKIGDSRHIVVHTDGSQGRLNYDYSPGNVALPAQFRNLTYNCISTATSRPDTQFPASDIYIGCANGIYRIPNGKSGSMECVTPDIIDVHDIDVTIDGNDISVWVTSSPDMVYYIYGKRNSATGIAWNMPIVFAKGVLKVTAMRNLIKKANELFVLGNDLSVWHYWQDPSSTSWRSSKAIVKEDAYVINFDSYTTHVHFESLGLPIPTQKVKITSSEWQYCTINGLRYSLDEDVPAEVSVDVSGNITIISAADDISPPVLHIQSDDFSETINIYPSGKVVNLLKSIQDGDSFKSSKLQDGSPVLDSTVDPSIADGIAANFVSLHGTAISEYPPALAGNNFVVLEKPQRVSAALGASKKPVKPLKHSLHVPMPTKHIPDDFAVGMKLHQGEWVQHDAKSAQNKVRSLAAASVSWTDVTNAAGDFWHFLKHIGKVIIEGLKDTAVFLSDGINFIVTKAGEVLQFVLTIGDKVVRIALKTFALVFKACSFLLSLVGIDLSKILKWFGHLIGWDLIWNTHNSLTATLTNFLDFGKPLVAQYIQTARDGVKKVFRTLDNDIQKVLLPEDLKSQSLAQPSNPPKDQLSDSNSPQTNYTTYHLLNSSSSATTDHDSPKTNGIVNGNVKAAGSNVTTDFLSDLYNDVVKPLWDVLKEKLGTDLDDLLNLLKHGSVDDFWKLLADLADTVLSVLAELFDGILHLAGDLIEDIIDAIEQPMVIPFFSALYEFVADLMGQPQEFTILRGISFLLAIPYVTALRIAGQSDALDKAASSGLDHPDFPQQMYNQIQKALGKEVKPALKSVGTKDFKLMAEDDRQFEPPLGLVIYSGVAGVINSIAATIYNVLDIIDKGNMSGGPLGGTMKKVVIGLAVVRLVFSAPMPKRGVSASAYITRWCGWSINNTWRLIDKTTTIQIQTKQADNSYAVNELWTSNFKGAVNMGSAITTLVIAIVCNSLDHAKPMAWSADMISNSGAVASGVGKFFDKAGPEAFALQAGGSAVAIVGNVIGGFNAGGSIVNAAAGYDVWNGFL
ncbi:hypothetical protein M501DRAFT_978492 [Patellaria atrata CBS 101060]|uniref:Uncharacterized protein n=1 Tax=Patellaria atrata CBS 101060 TaxID=1346257 RepID=A0A9P4VLC0_9PEZI|nr:hypothetical protein M501DRAFT_978492 [Patellaria atrata CBS 101060]